MTAAHDAARAAAAVSAYPDPGGQRWQPDWLTRHIPERRLPEPDIRWKARGACRDHPVAVFYPGASDGRISPTTAAKAKAICASCPVKAECLDYALTTSEPDGIWGGQTPYERRHGTTPRPADPRCGTRAGESAHLRRGETICPACRTAKNEYQADWKKRQTA